MSSLWSIRILPLLCAISLLVFLPVHGEEYPEPKTIMWSIRSATNTVYILGSIHTFHKKYYPLPRAIEEAYAQCRHIVFETKVNPMEITLKQAAVMKNVQYLEGDSLENHLSPRTLALLQSRLKRYDMSFSEVKSYKPWLVASIMSGIEFSRSGFQHELGIDYHFLRKAGRDGKQKYFLEQIQFQIDLFAKTSPAVQDQFLHYTLLHGDILEVTLHDLARAWIIGSESRIDDLVLEPLRGYPELYDLLLVQRNKNWVSQIERIMKEKHDFFVVVGCGHLIGRDSLIEMLQQRGHRINRH